MQAGTQLVFSVEQVCHSNYSLLPRSCSGFQPILGKQEHLAHLYAADYCFVQPAVKRAIPEHGMCLTAGQFLVKFSSISNMILL